MFFTRSTPRGSLQKGGMTASLPYMRRLVNTTQAYPPEATGLTVARGEGVYRLVVVMLKVSHAGVWFASVGTWVVT